MRFVLHNTKAKILPSIKGRDMFNVQLKNGEVLIIPAEYYPRCALIIATKENLFTLKPISRLEALFKSFTRNIFNHVFAVLSVINVSICTPLLITSSSGNPKSDYYFYLFLGFITSFYITKIYTNCINTQSFSIDSVARQLGYESSCSMLKPYDERMLKSIIDVNSLKISRATLFFDDLYGIIFDVATTRRIADIFFRRSHLKIIK